MTKQRIKPAPVTLKNAALPASTGDPLIDHAVTVMDLAGFQSKVSRKMLAYVLSAIRKHGPVRCTVMEFSKQVNLNSHYTQNTFTILQEFGLVVLNKEGGRHYYVDEEQLRNPSVRPVKRVRRESQKFKREQAEREKANGVNPAPKVVPRTRCPGCGCKVEQWAGKLCLGCDLIGRLERKN